MFKICQDCSDKYIDETGKQLPTRINEHQKDIKEETLLSHVTSHAYVNEYSTLILPKIYINALIKVTGNY